MSATSDIELPQFGRQRSIGHALSLIERIGAGKLNIVETGAIRDDRPSARQGDGWSTLAWGNYASAHAGRVYTVDCDPKALEISRRLTSECADHIE